MAAFIALLEDPNLPVVQGGPDTRKELKHWLLEMDEGLQFYDNPAVLSRKIHDALGWRAKGPTHKVLDALIERLALDEDAKMTKYTGGKRKSAETLTREVVEHIVGLFQPHAYSGLQPPLDDPPSGFSRVPCYVSKLTHPDAQCPLGNKGARPRSARHVRPPPAPLAPRAARAGLTHPCEGEGCTRHVHPGCALSLAVRDVRPPLPPSRSSPGARLCVVPSSSPSRSPRPPLRTQPCPCFGRRRIQHQRTFERTTCRP